jgi:hypothetical protein
VQRCNTLEQSSAALSSSSSSTFLQGHIIRRVLAFAQLDELWEQLYLTVLFHCTLLLALRCTAHLLQAPNTQLTLNGARSTSDNGAILQYLWRIFPYNSTTAITTAKGPTVTLQAPATGQYNVTLDVWDVLGGHASGSTALSVDAGNVLDWWSATPTFATPAAAALPKPTAVLALNGSIGSAFTVNARSGAGAVVQLDGSASSDAKGSKLAYAWKITQTQPSVAAVNPMLGFNQPATFIYR